MWVRGMLRTWDESSALKPEESTKASLSSCMFLFIIPLLHLVLSNTSLFACQRSYLGRPLGTV